MKKRIFAMLAAVCCMLALFPFGTGAQSEAESDAQRVERAKMHISNHDFTAAPGFLALAQQRMAQDAAPAGLDEEAFATGIDCGIPSCTGTMSERVTNGPWGYTGNTKTCPYNWKLNDLEESRSVIYTYQCNRCGYSFNYSDTQYRWECGH